MGTRISAFIVALPLFSVLVCPGLLQGRNDSDEYRSGPPEWRALNALGRQAQLEMQLRRDGLYRPLSETQPPAANDIGNIAVIDDDGAILVQPNWFDLPNRSVRFTPDGAGYRVSGGPMALDTNAAAAGTVLVLDDDDTREVPLAFNFPLYGKTYGSVFINSDGNLTFGSGDAAQSARDFARFLTGAPRIAPFFADLNPADGGQVSYTSDAGRFVVTWKEVPECCAPPARAVSTFQAALYPDGTVQLAYGTVLSQSAVVGISPGNFTAVGNIVDLSVAGGNSIINGPIAETFQAKTMLSEAAAARKFYAAHEDAYDYLIFWTNFPVNMDRSAFAYQLPVANDTLGIGLKKFDYSRSFGSLGRLSSFIMMADVRRFPADPAQPVPGIQPKTTLSALGEESGHRWLAYTGYPYNAEPRSNILLGRDNQHWSFFFNSDASLMEGNRIADNGDGSFTTTGVIEHYNRFDQYAMGLRPPEEVAPSFVVTLPDIPYAGRMPQSGITFHGSRMDVNIDGIVQANGPRIPKAAVAQKNFRLAFILINGRGNTATQQQIQQLDLIRQQWEPYWTQAADGLSQADTRLLRSLALGGLPVAVMAGTPVTVRLQCGGTADVPRSFTLSSNNTIVSVPGMVTAPAGSREVQFQAATTANPGIARIKASADGYETAEGVVSVTNIGALQLNPISGGGQVGRPSATLANPLVVEVRDANLLPVVGATVRFSATGTAGVNPATAVTDGSGRAQTIVTLGKEIGAFTITAALAGGPQTSFTVNAFREALVPSGSAVNAASFAPAPAPISPGSIVSIFGSNLAVDTVMAGSVPLATKLGGASVQINGLPAPLFMVSPGQINAQVPFEVSGSTATLTVDNGASRTAPISVALAASAPGIFTAQYGSGPGAVLHGTDYTPVTSTSPAADGEIVAIYCTGLGAVSPSVETGRPPPAGRPPQTVDKPQVSIGGMPAEVLFAGLAPGFVGLYQVNVRVPSDLTPGSLPLVITTSLNSSNIATLAVQ